MKHAEVFIDRVIQATNSGLIHWQSGHAGSFIAFVSRPMKEDLSLSYDTCSLEVCSTKPHSVWLVIRVDGDEEEKKVPRDKMEFLKVSIENSGPDYANDILKEFSDDLKELRR